MVIWSWHENSFLSAALPIECPRCGRETMHAYGKHGKDPALFSVSVPVGIYRAFVHCLECELTRPVPWRDRIKLRRVLRYNPPKAYGRGPTDTHVETSLGRVCADPARIRRYYLSRASQVLHAVLPIFMALLGMAGVAYIAFMGWASVTELSRLTRAEILRILDAASGTLQALVVVIVILCLAILGWAYIAGLFALISHLVASESLMQAYTLMDAEEYKASFHKLNAARLLYHWAGRPAEEAFCWIWIGHKKVTMGDWTGARKAYNASLAVSLKGGELRRAGVAQGCIGQLCEAEGQYPTALYYYGQAMSTLREAGALKIMEYYQERIDKVRKLLDDQDKSSDT